MFSFTISHMRAWVLYKRLAIFSVYWVPKTYRWPEYVNYTSVTALLLNKVESINIKTI